MKMNWKKYDFYTKSMEGTEEKTRSGAILTFFSWTIAILLVYSELMRYMSVTVASHMKVDTTSQTVPIQVSLDIEFLQEPCQDIKLTVTDSHGYPDTLLANNINMKNATDKSCRIQGSLTIAKVSGEIGFMHKGALNIYNIWELLNFNSTHVIHHLRFGPVLEGMETPLVNIRQDVIEDRILYKYFIHMVPTAYRQLSGKKTDTYQYSVTEHMREGEPSYESIVLPGVSFTYDFSSIMVEYKETKPSILEFITAMSAIVGGVFGVARLLDSVVYRATSIKKD